MKKLIVVLTLFAFLYAPAFAQKNLEPHEVDALEREALQSNTPETETIKPIENKTDTNDAGINLSTTKSILLDGYELDVDGQGAFRLSGLDGIDFFPLSGTPSGMLGWIRHTASANGTMFLTNNVGNLHLYSTSGQVKTYSAGSLTMVADENQNIGIGIAAPTTRLDVEGHSASTDPVTQSIVTYTGIADVKAVQGTSLPAPGYGYGVQGTGGYRGVYGYGNGTTYTGSIYGVYGNASNSSTGTAYGIYGSASTGAGGRAYGIYASGDLKVSSQVFIGTNTTQEDAAVGFELVVDGEALVEELKVELSGSWPDYVFDKTYDLKPLEEVETFINENGHLPNLPSASQVEEEGGFFVGDIQKRLLEKVEELTLYMIDLKKENENLKKENEEIKSLIQDLKNK